LSSFDPLSIDQIIHYNFELINQSLTIHKVE